MSNEIIWVCMLLVVFSTITILHKRFGIIGLFVYIPIGVILCNIQVTKLVELFGITLTLGNVLYASNFLVTDILSEYYSKEKAKQAIIIGFCTLVFLQIFSFITLQFTPSQFDFAHGSLETIFSFLPRLLVASLFCFLVSQFLDVKIYHLLKTVTGDKIYIRNNVSTIISQLVDSILFNVIAFYGVFSNSILIEMTIGMYILKCIVALIDTFFIYLNKPTTKSIK